MLYFKWVGIIMELQLGIVICTVCVGFCVVWRHARVRAGGDVLHELITLEHTYLQIGGKYIMSGEEALC